MSRPASAADIPIQVRDVALTFGGIRALDGVSLEVRTGEVFGVIGPNGAGKTSLLNCLNGAYKPAQGEISFFGTDITSMRPYKIAALGISRTFQTVSLMPQASVLENILVGTHSRSARNLLASVFRVGSAWSQERRLRAEVAPLVELLDLGPHVDREAGLLPLGMQRRVEIARALAADARLIVFDEPTSGMNAEERAEMGQLIRTLQRTRGLNQLIVEHDARFMREVCDRITVLNFGRVIAEGTPQAVFSDPAVIEAYLGRGHAGSDGAG